MPKLILARMDLSATGVERGECVLLKNLSAQSERCQIIHLLANSMGSHGEVDSALSKLVQGVHLCQVCVRLDLNWNRHPDRLEVD